jgi:hypothetical protein
MKLKPVLTSILLSMLAGISISETIPQEEFDKRVAAIRASKKVKPSFRVTQEPIDLFPGFGSDSLVLQMRQLAGKPRIVMAQKITMVGDDPIVLDEVRINHKPSVPGCGAGYIVANTGPQIMPMGSSFLINPTECDGEIILIELFTSSGVISIRN